MTTTYYDTTYGNFQTSLYQEIRREAYGEDIGQNGWLTADEQNKFISWLGLTAGKTLLVPPSEWHFSFDNSEKFDFGNQVQVNEVTRRGDY